MLPNSFRRKLAYYSTPFGGLKEIESLLEEERLVDLVISEDPIVLINPLMSIFKDNEVGLDLTQFEFSPGSSFSVFNDQDEFLYKRSSSRYFGNQEIDRQVVETTNHGRYLQLRLDNPIPKRVLLWVYRRPTEQQIQKKLWALEREKDAQRPPKETELIVQFSRSVKLEDYPISVYYLEGYTNVSKKELISISEDKFQNLTYYPNDILYMRPKSDLTLYIEQNNTPLTWLEDSLINLDPNQLELSEEGIITLTLRKKRSRKISANQSIKATDLEISSNQKVSSAGFTLRR